MAAGQDPGGTTALSVAEHGTEQITIRKCAGIDELNACVALQKEVWNFSDVDLIPLRMFVVSQKIGGQTIGAFQWRRSCGLCLFHSRQPRRTCLPAFAHAGCARLIS